MKVPVKGTGFVKDMNNGALLSVNKTVLLENEARKRLKAKINAKDTEINNLKNQIISLNNDVSDIKKMLQHLIKRD